MGGSGGSERSLKLVTQIYCELATIKNTSFSLLLDDK